MLVGFLANYFEGFQIAMMGVVFAWVLTFILLKCEFGFLPHDQGRDFAVNGALSKGKLRGVGIVMVFSYLVASVLFVQLTKEYVIYGVLLFATMLSGYLDDAADKPWSDYKKGAIDLVISIMALVTFVMKNSTTIYIFTYTIDIPKPIFVILGIILIWVSINVTNCSDGVDGLCATLCVITMFSFGYIFYDELGSYAPYSFIFIGVLLAYLYFNCSPSSMLMGDAGSRALGFFLAILALKCGHPFSFIPLAIVLIVDGGAGLVKIFLLRFFKIKVLSNTRTPIHDDKRKNVGWSDTQVVFRFMIIQMVVSVLFSVVL